MRPRRSGSLLVWAHTAGDVVKSHDVAAVGAAAPAGRPSVVAVLVGAVFDPVANMPQIPQPPAGSHATFCLCVGWLAPRAGSRRAKAAGASETGAGGGPSSRTRSWSRRSGSAPVTVPASSGDFFR